MNINEEERRARLLKSRAERLPGIKKQFAENQAKKQEIDIKAQFEAEQGRNFNSNFAPGGKDENLVKKPAAKKATKKPPLSQESVKSVYFHYSKKLEKRQEFCYTRDS